jgi:hypothetical protein
MKTVVKFAVSALVLGAVLSPFAAQARPFHRHRGIDAREHRQQERIKQGVKSGQLTYNETRRLERRETGIRRAELRDRRHNHGRLTAFERRRLNRRLNRTSHAIYRAKHNGAVR